jgi:energy-coupling factor transporter ATP-binding protein EcfA2
MKLKSAHVTNFRSILDSGPVEIEATTCLVGKNEAGKTAFLKALEGLKPVNKSYAYDKTRDFPRRDLSKYDRIHEGGDATVISTVWELEEDDIEALTDEFGEAAVSGTEITLERGYGDGGKNWTVPIDEGAVLARLYERFGLKVDDKKPLKGIASTSRAATLLAGLEERSPEQNELLAHIKTYRSERAILKAIDLLKDRVPTFLYFSHYDRMNGELSVNQLRQDQQKKVVDPGDQVFLDFLNYAGTNLDELANATEFEELNSKCEAAANAITDEIFEYWTQNDQLEIQVTVDAGKADDPPPFNAGMPDHRSGRSRGEDRSTQCGLSGRSAATVGQ